MPSSFRNLFKSSNSLSVEFRGGASMSFGRGRRGARPGAGKTHWMWARRQLEHGISLSQRTLRRLHVTQLRGFKAGPLPDMAGVVDGIVTGGAVPAGRTVKVGMGSPEGD
jgi:hypothetical protein